MGNLMCDERAIKFISSLKECSLVYHGDSDGVCSAALMYKFLGKKIKIVSPNDSYGIYVTERLMDDINKFKNNIFVDLAVDMWDYEKLKNSVLVIDHHTPRTDLNKVKNFVYINPRLKNLKSYVPASRLVYDLLCKMDKKMERYAWIAAVGVIGDKGDPEGIKFKGKKEDLQFLSDVIEASKGMLGCKGVVKAYDVFSAAENPKDVLDSRLIETYKKFQKEVDEVCLDFRYHAEHFGKSNAYLYKVYNRYNLTSIVSTKLSEKERDAAFFLYKRDKVISMSARCQTGRINLAELFKRICEGLGKGGGHPQAAAANIPLNNADKFMERLRNYLEGI